MKTAPTRLPSVRAATAQPNGSENMVTASPPVTMVSSIRFEPNHTVNRSAAVPWRWSSAIGWMVLISRRVACSPLFTAHLLSHLLSRAAARRLTECVATHNFGQSFDVVHGVGARARPHTPGLRHNGAGVDSAAEHPVSYRHNETRVVADGRISGGCGSQPCGAGVHGKSGRRPRGCA